MTAPIKTPTPMLIPAVDDVLVVSVTEQDIRDGERGKGSHCPIALALRRQTGGLRPSVQPEQISLWRDYPGVVGPSQLVAAFRTSSRVGSFIHDFDDGRPVPPCTLTLRRLA